LPAAAGRERVTVVPRYLVSFDDGAMQVADDDDLAALTEAGMAVVAEARAAGVWVIGRGVPSQRATIVGTDGAVTQGEYPERKAVVGGFAFIDVASHAEAVEWAARIAVACRCAQEVRELVPEPPT
jgi:hypothetical protein